MPDERALAAIARIERALARIEEAANRSPQPAGGDDELSALKQKHAALREEVEGAVGELDRLLAAHGAA